MTGRPVVPPPAAAAQPYLRVVQGRPAPAELAALVAALLVRDRAAQATARSAPPPRSAWGDPGGALRRSRNRGPDGSTRRLPHT